MATTYTHTCDVCGKNIDSWPNNNVFIPISVRTAYATANIDICSEECLSKSLGVVLHQTIQVMGQR